MSGNIPPGADTRAGILTESMFQLICSLGGWQPTPRRRGGLSAWSPNEGMPVWINNPMATEWPGGVGGVARSTWSLGLPGIAPGQWNSNGSYGVGIYATETDGARAFVNTVRQPPPAFSFKPIADWIDGDCIVPADPSKLIANMNSWGTSGFATILGTGWQPPLLSDPNPPPAPVATADLPDKAILAIFGSTEADPTARLANARARYEAAAAGIATDGSQYSPRDLAVNALGVAMRPAAAVADHQHQPSGVAR